MVATRRVWFGRRWAALRVSGAAVLAVAFPLAVGTGGCGGGEPPPRCNYVFTVGQPLCTWLASQDALNCGSSSFTLPNSCITTSCSCPIPSQTCNSQIPTAIPAECLNVAQVFQCTGGGISPISGLCQIVGCECFGLPPA